MSVAFAAYLAAVSPILASPPSADVRRAIDYVSGLDEDVVYADGYLPREDPSLLTMEGISGMLPAAYLAFYRLAWERFLELPDLSDEQRKPHHYKVGFELADGVLTVIVQGLLLPRLADGEPEGFIRTTLGPSVRYRFDYATKALIDSHRLR